MAKAAGLLAAHLSRCRRKLGAQSVPAIQLYDELTRVMMQRWVVRGAHRFELPGVQPGREHLGDQLIWDMLLKWWLAEFLG